MRIRAGFFLSCAAALLLTAGGCGPQLDIAPPADEIAPADDSAELIAAPPDAAAGDAQPTQVKPDRPEPVAPEAGWPPENAETGPHHGYMLETGEAPFDIEFVHSPRVGRVSIYFTDRKGRPAEKIRTEPHLAILLPDYTQKLFITKSLGRDRRFSRFEAGGEELKGNYPTGEIRVTVGTNNYNVRVRDIRIKSN